MTTRQTSIGLLAATALIGLGLIGCGPKPADQADQAENAAPLAETVPGVDANVSAAIDTAGNASAGTEAANVAAATDPGPPPANIADVRDAAGDEGSLEAKAKVSNAAKAGRLDPPPKPAR
jgi:hypothetical protein